MPPNWTEAALGHSIAATARVRKRGLFLLNLPIAAQRVPTAARMHMSPHDAEIFADFSRKPPFLDHFEDETRNDDAN